MKKDTSEKSPFDAAMDCAVRLLARRSHTSLEIREKLRQRGFIVDVIEAVLARCGELGYINDAETTRRYFQELAGKGRGPRRIRQDMQKKGLTGEIVDRLVSEYVAGADELAAARRILEKNARRFDRESDPRKRREKIYRFLYSRGFSGGVIIDVMREFF